MSRGRKKGSIGKPEAARNCPSCGRPVPGEALFCPMDGTPVEGANEGARDPLLNQIVADRYLMKQRLGQGGSGIIYRAEHTTLSKPLALKVLHHHLSSDDRAIERFRREATTV